MAQDILQLSELQHKVEVVPEREWVEAIKVQMGSDAFVVHLVIPSLTDLPSCLDFQDTPFMTYSPRCPFACSTCSYGN